MPAIITALLLAIARVIGETAPLLFTAFGSQFWESESESADGGARAASLYVRHFTVSELAGTGMGRRVVADRGRLRAQPRRAADVAPRDAGPRSMSAVAAGELLATQELGAYYGTRQAIADVTIAFRRKAVTALIGPSGCGKTTLLRCFNRIHEIGFDARVEGSVLLDGHDIYGNDVDPMAIRRRIGMVFQRPNPFPTLSIFDNTVACAPKGLNRQGKLEAAERALRSAALGRSEGQTANQPAVLRRAAAASLHRARRRGAAGSIC